MAPILYHVPKTISSPIYQALLELSVVDNPIQIQTLSFADLKTPEHLARNPMGTSPAFTDDEHGIAIWESGAVLTYLLEMYDTTYLLYPKPGESKADRAKFLQLQQFILATVYPFVASLFIHTLKPKEEQDEAYIDSSIGKWKVLLAPSLEQFLGDAPYFMGDKVSAIDFLVAKPLNNADSLGALKDFPTLHALLERIRCLPSFDVAYQQAAPSDCGECRTFTLVPTEGDSKDNRGMPLRLR